jgi:Domain of unknown function (DUF4270)
MTRNRLFGQLIHLFLLVPALLVLILAGCTKPSINFGNSFSNNNATNVVAVDTFGVKMSTVFLDSFPTASTGTALIGTYQDPFLGKISSRTYFEVGPPMVLPTISNLATYDSFCLIMHINKGFYGDTTVPQRYNVSQLTNLIDLPDVQTTFYNNNSITYDPTVLGFADVQINPTADFTSQKINDTVKIRMPDTMGQQFFQMLFNQSDTLKSAATFRGFFKGLTLYPANASVGSIYGFRDSIYLRMYYHEPGLVITESFTDFPFTNKQNQFNQITFDRTNSPAAGIDSLHTEVPSESTGNVSFEQTATGLYTKLLFPTISSLLQYQDYLSVLKAELTIRPVQGSYSPIFALPPQINLALTSNGNNIGNILNVGAGSLSIDYLSGTNTAYSYDITAYIKQQILLGPVINQNYGLILTVPAPAGNTTFNRAIFGNQLNANNINKISLKIYYASYY